VNDDVPVDGPRPEVLAWFIPGGRLQNRGAPTEDRGETVDAVPLDRPPLDRPWPELPPDPPWPEVLAWWARRYDGVAVGGRHFGPARCAVSEDGSGLDLSFDPDFRPPLTVHFPIGEQDIRRFPHDSLRWAGQPDYMDLHLLGDSIDEFFHDGSLQKLDRAAGRPVTYVVLAD
jgi:hypothetical protein